MRKLAPSILGLISAGSIAALTGLPAHADDTEIFVNQPETSVQPNILLIVDTSGSMQETAESTKTPYDPTVSYADGSADCDDSRLYYTNSSTAPNDCDNLPWISASYMKCLPAINAVVNTGDDGETGVGFYSDRFIRWGGSGSSRGWNNSLNPNNGTDVECNADSGVHGPDSTSSGRWPRTGIANQSGGRWTSTESSSFWGSNSGLSRTFYSPNYIRWVRNGPVQNQSRMEVVRAAAASFTASLPNVNLGVMRYSTNNHNYSGYQTDASGGMVISAVSPLDPKRAALISSFNNTAPGNMFVPHGWTPMSETLFEAYRYFSGGTPEFGTNSRICTENTGGTGTGTCRGSSYMLNLDSVAESRIAPSYTYYDSPADESCQANYIVFLTDGLPTQDNEANASINALPDFATLGGACDTTDSYSGPGGSNAGRCLGALSEYMFNADLRPDDVDGQQNVRTFYIGFGNDPALTDAFGYLQDAATRGGGQAYQATDLSALTAVFNTIITSILQTSTTFTAPAVTVNAFNRTQTLDDIYLSVFQPDSATHWPGNVKKYRVVDDAIVDSNGSSAVNPSTGFFNDSARSYWSDVVDGSEVALGGAAAEIPAPASRNVYTFIGPNPGAPVGISSGAEHLFNTANTDIVPLLGLGASGDPTPEDLINWARGVDIRNEDGNTATTVRRVMGDSLHSSPAVVVYGGTEDNPDAVVFSVTNDGFLHALDADTGAELWSYVPQEVLPYLKELFFNSPVPTKNYTLDGQIRILRFDVNGDGTIDTSEDDRVILYFGHGRGGSNYYAIDVSNRNSPRFMWTLGTGELSGIGQAWSTPTIGRVNISGATQNSQRLVLVIGGGYDTAEDASTYVSSSSVGNRIFMVDALRGTLLWSAGLSGADFDHPRMEHSIPSSVTVLDTNGDRYVDRMYVGDMAAQLWRFDITNGNDRDNLVAGGVIASLGTRDLSPVVPSQSRRFYSAPDVAPIQRPTGTIFFNIAIGSGYRGHPLNTLVQDRFYSIRDYQPFASLTQAQYDAYSIITDALLDDVTLNAQPTLAINSPGWKLQLNQPGGSWRGEKSLSPSRTFDSAIFFTTYLPPDGASTAACSLTSSGSNRVYVVSAYDGSPIPQQGDSEITPEDRYQELAQGSIAPEVSFLFPGDEDDCTGDDCSSEPPCEGEECRRRQMVCLSGVEVLNVCRDFNSRIKTYWRESAAE